MSEYDPTDLQAQERIKADRDTERRLAKDSEESDIKWLMGSRRGRRIVWRLLSQSGVFRTSFNTNAMSMAFAEGNRNFGNRLLDLVHRACPESYLKMVSEANERRNTNDD